MQLRQAVQADLLAVVEIYNSTVASRMVTADTEAVSLESRQSWFEEHDPTTRPLYVLEIEGEIAAWLSFQSFYGRPAYQATAEISIYVAAAYRRQGLGRYLLEQAIERSPDLSIKNLVGFIFAHNLPSLALFESYGFQRWGYFPDVARLDGVERSLVIVGHRIE